MSTQNTFVDPTDPGHDVDVLREHVKHLERQVRQLTAQIQPVSPSREALIMGLALIALHGLEQEIIAGIRSAAKQFGRDENPYENYAVIEVRRVTDLIKQGKPASSKSRTIAENVTFARQMVRVSYEEWEEVIQFTQE